MRATRNNDLANCFSNSSEQIVSIGEKDKKKSVLENLPAFIKEMHENRTCWIHDLEFYDITYNCIGVNPSQLIHESNISFSLACTKLYSEITNLTNMQSGGIGLIDFDSDMSQYIHGETETEVEDILFQLLILLNLPVRKGCELAYVTINFGLCTTNKGKMISRGLLRAYSRQQFVFPNLVFKIKAGINRYESDINYDIFELACKTTACCMNPTYLNTDSKFNAEIPPEKFGVMGCRTRIATNRFNSASSLNRGNIASTTINLVQLALKCDGDIKTFFSLLNDTMQIAKKCLIYRMDILTAKPAVAYIKENGLYLNSNSESGFDTLKNGTLAIGFIGLWDAMAVLFKKDFTESDNLRKYYHQSYKIVEYMRKTTDTFSKEENLNFSLLASSAEGVSGYFAEYDSKHYEEAKSVTDKGYYTNSFHIPVSANISCFEKLSLEAPFHALCNGGHITYVELKEAPDENNEAVKELIEFACQQDIGYFGINYPLDVCCDCSEKGLFKEVCDKCGSRNIRRLRRVSGYLSDENNFTFGKSQELKNRKSNENLICSYDILNSI